MRFIPIPPHQSLLELKPFSSYNPFSMYMNIVRRRKKLIVPDTIYNLYSSEEYLYDEWLFTQFSEQTHIISHTDLKRKDDNQHLD